MAFAFTRVTLLGSSRHLDLLLPSEQPVGLLVPQILDLLRDSPRHEVAEKVLVTSAGDPLDAGATLQEAGVLDGAVLTLFNAADAPPPPVIYDVTDAVVEEADAVAGRWADRYRRATAATVAAASLAGASCILLGLAGAQAWWLLLALGVLFLAAGAASGRSFPVLGRSLIGAGWLTSLGGTLQLAAPGPEKAILVAALSTVALAALGLAARRPRPLLSAATILALLTALWAATALLAGDGPRSGGVAALLSILVLGLLPRMALSSSGLAALDDRRADGGLPGRVDALTAIQSAHRSLTLGTVLCAASIAIGLLLLSGDAGARAWSLPLLLALTLATALRARAFPLAAERLSLYAAAGAGTVGLALALPAFLPALPWLPAVLLVLLAAGMMTAMQLDLPDHVSARFRLLANRLESVAVLASVPLLIGMFGVFAQLVRSFG